MSPSTDFVNNCKYLKKNPKVFLKDADIKIVS